MYVYTHLCHVTMFVLWLCLCFVCLLGVLRSGGCAFLSSVKFLWVCLLIVAMTFEKMSGTDTPSQTLIALHSHRHRHIHYNVLDQEECP